MSDCRMLPDGWVEAKIEDVSQPSGAWSPKTSASDEFWYVDIEALDNTQQVITSPKRLKITEAPSRARVAIKAGDVLFSLVRPYLKNIAVVPVSLDGQVASTAYCAVRPDNVIESKYLYYALVRDSFIKSVVTYGNSPPSGHDDEFMRMTLPIAPLAEQRRIVAAIEEQFTRLDAGVAALRRAQAALKRYRAAVLKAAVEGRLTAAWRAQHADVRPAKALLADILAERRAKWEADLRAKGKDPAKARYEEPKPPQTEGLPELPQGWVWATVEQVTGRSEYGTSVKCSYETEGVPVLRIPNIAAGEIDLVDMKYATMQIDIGDDDQLQAGDLLMCRTNGSVNLIGKTAVIRSELDGPHTFASYLLRFRLMEANILPGWLHLFVSSPQGRRFIEGNAASSAGQHNISLTLIHRMLFPLPSLGEQKQIVAEIEQRLSVVSVLEAAIAVNLKRAERLRQAILERAFTGRLVPQEAGDEPASALLERVRREREGTGLVSSKRVASAAQTALWT